MRRRMNQFNLPPWVRNARNVCQQFVVPICVFQGIRTLLLPTTFDLLFLVLLIGLALALHFEMI